MSGDRRESPPVIGGGNGVVEPEKKPAPVIVPSQRLRLHANKDHMPESYEDLQLDFCPSIFSSLEKYLPPNMLHDSREEKVKFMRDILLKYLPHGERTRVRSNYHAFRFFLFFFVENYVSFPGKSIALLGFCLLFLFNSLTDI
jgi:hypothetical protein